MSGLPPAQLLAPTAGPRGIGNPVEWIPPGTNIFTLPIVWNNENLSGTGSGTTGVYQQTGLSDEYKKFSQGMTTLAMLLNPFTLVEALLGIGTGGPPNGLYLILGVGLIMLGGLALALAVVEISLPPIQVQAGPAKVSVGKKSKK